MRKLLQWVIAGASAADFGRVMFGSRASGERVAAAVKRILQP